MRFRYDIINALIEKFKYEKYLEIGVQNKANTFLKVNASFKLCVDPDKDAKADYVMTSDEFFADKSLFITQPKFDIIFVDGLHHADQVQKDIDNSLNWLSEGGTIVCHDMSPIVESHTRVPRVTKNWNGDVYKTWIDMKQKRADLSMFVVDTDWGCGIIRRGHQQPITIANGVKINFQNLEANRKEWLNLISVEEFQEWLRK